MKQLKENGGVDNYSFAGIFLDVNGFNVGFHESEKIFNTHFLLLFDYLQEFATLFVGLYFISFVIN